jgi:uncharacterized protein with HEPN domain
LPFKSAKSHLDDIIDAIGMIEQLTADYDFESFRQDPKTIAAVERKLLSIAEGAGRMRRSFAQISRGGIFAE